MNNSLATNNNQPQNEDGDSVGDKSEGVVHKHCRGQHDSNNNHSYLGGWGEGLVT